jgi:acyl carrier protein
MTRDEINNMVINVIAEQMGVDETNLDPSVHLIDDLNADSLDTVELIMTFEDEFEIAIPDEQAEKLRTIGEIQTFIADLLHAD